MYHQSSLPPFARPSPLRPSQDGNRVLRPIFPQHDNMPDPSAKIGPSKLLSAYLDLPAEGPRSRRDFEVYNDGQFDAAETLHSKEIFAGNQIKLCVGVDPAVTEALRLSKEDGELNRRLLRDREEYLTRHPGEENVARSVYKQVEDQVIDLLQKQDFHCLWPFAMVFSCYEFTSHRRNFQHGHCLYLMVTVPSQESWNSVETLRKLVIDLIRCKGPAYPLHVIIQEISQHGMLSDGRPRILESQRGRCLPKNIDYHVRPPMGSSIGPPGADLSGTIGGYVTTQSGKVYAVTASHTVGDQHEAVVSPSTVDLDTCYMQASAKEQLALQELEFHLRSIGPNCKETFDSRRKWEIAQEELLVFADAGKAAGPVCEFGTVHKKSQGALYVSHEGTTIKSYLDLALVECHGLRTGFNTVPCTLWNGSSAVYEVNAARSPLHGERVVKNGRSTGLTHGNILSELAVVGYFETELVTVVWSGVTASVEPRIIKNWCITSSRRTREDNIFAGPGDSGAWVLSEPQVSGERHGPEVLVSQIPVLGAVLHGFVSVEGVDLVMFQPWEFMAEGFEQLTGEECVPCLPLSDNIALFRELQGTVNGCGVCLQEGQVDHSIDQCPERFQPEGSRALFVRTNGGVRVLDQAEDSNHHYRPHKLSRVPFRAQQAAPLKAPEQENTLSSPPTLSPIPVLIDADALSSYFILVSDDDLEM
ncbi:hypothetical protein TWF679_011122 [Orbilia oligospora]|uniref:Uncharacterized protein n=1 Tax=Orbilia oligospora TaxID=2813651 RepID=A0A8H8UYV2_ORBOL|nr:hypothetical protein TWF679_011122 [Orbilia oligospora]